VRLGPEAEVTYRGVIGQKLLLHPLSCREFLAAIIIKTRLLLSPALACPRLLSPASSSHTSDKPVSQLSPGCRILLAAYEYMCGCPP
jgi:hypothetical protein